MKKNLLSIIAVLLAVTFTAFTAKSKVVIKKDTDKYFIYKAYPSIDPSDLGNPANYELTTNGGLDALDCPSGTANRCGVLAPENSSGQPVLMNATIFLRQ